MKRVVVAPLDWGLGHATRCVPIIQELFKRKCQVYIVSSGSALQLLQQEFPQLPSIQIESYKASYAARLPLMIAVFLQLPKFLRVIRKEHRQLEDIVIEHKIDLVISDNRYGCWSSAVPSVFITHQTTIQMPFALKWIQPSINYFNAHFINRFAQCWIPDTSGTQNLSGVLSKFNSKKIKARHIGILSRFKKTSIDTNFKYRIAIVLSGPEPQRSILEKIMMSELAHSTFVGPVPASPYRRDDQVVLVRGVVEDNVRWKSEANLMTVNFLPSAQLEEIINQSELVIARSGYSAIMDLAKLQKKAILIPTPGQTEQEYLAERLMRQRICFSMRQHDFNLDYALKQSAGFKGFSNIEVSNQLLLKALDEVLVL
jgi:uncharacterized protein (TIGR00661 family)